MFPTHRSVEHQVQGWPGPFVKVPDAIWRANDQPLQQCGTSIGGAVRGAAKSCVLEANGAALAEALFTAMVATEAEKCAMHPQQATIYVYGDPTTFSLSLAFNTPRQWSLPRQGQECVDR